MKFIFNYWDSIQQKYLRQDFTVSPTITTDSNKQDVDCNNGSGYESEEDNTERQADGGEGNLSRRRFRNH